MNNKNVFSIRLFIHNFLQLKLVGILSTIVIAAFLINEIVSAGMANARNTVSTAYYSLNTTFATSSITGGSLWALVATFAVVTPVLMLMAFNYNNKRSSSDFYNSLPFTRLNLFLTNIAAVMAWIVIIFVVSIAVIAVSISIYSDYFVYSASSLAWFIFGAFVANLLCAASISIACALTGNIISNICLSGLIMFLPLAVRVFINAIVEIIFPRASAIQAVPLIGSEKNIIGALAYYEFGSRSGGFTSVFTDRGNIAFSIVLAIVYFIIGYLLFVRRKSEIAGKASVGNHIQSAIRVIIGFILVEIAAVLITAGVDSSSVLIIALLFMMGFIAIFVYELLTGEKQNILKKTAVSYITACLIAAVFSGLTAVGANAMDRYVADADDISYIRIVRNNTYSYSTVSDYFTDQSAKINIADKDVITKIAAAYNDNKYKTYREISNNYNDSVIDLDVYIKDGLIAKRRSVLMSAKEYKSLLESLGNVQEYQSVYTTLPDSAGANFGFNGSIAMGQDNAKKLYETLKEEIKTADFTTYITAYNDSNECDYIHVEFVEDNTDYRINIPFTTATPKSTKLYMELANETAKNTSVGNVDYDAVKKMLIDALDENKVYNLGYNTSVDIYTVNLDTQKGASIFTSYMSGISGDTYDIDEESSYYQGTTDYVESQKNKDYEAAFERISECLKSGSFGSIDITKTFYKIIVRVYAQDDVNGTEDRVYYYIFIQ